MARRDAFWPKLTVKVDAITASARKKIEDAGGTVDVIPRLAHRPKFVKKGQTTPSTASETGSAEEGADA